MTPRSSPLLLTIVLSLAISGCVAQPDIEAAGGAAPSGAADAVPVPLEPLSGEMYFANIGACVPPGCVGVTSWTYADLNVRDAVTGAVDITWTSTSLLTEKMRVWMSCEGPEGGESVGSAEGESPLSFRFEVAPAPCRLMLDFSDPNAGATEQKADWEITLDDA